MKKCPPTFSKVATGNFIYLLFVICFGAYVRMTGSGAGCGNHWPLCNGTVIPREPVWQTVIEFSHRLTSGGLLLFCLYLMRSAFKSFPKGYPVRKLSVLYFFLLILEALLGAFLVKYEHVAANKSIYRGFSVSLHLINTFLLVSTASALIYFKDYTKILKKRIPTREKIFLSLGLVLIIFVGLSGAITALGDTLFPVESMWEALLKSQSTAEHVFVRLRVYHPFLAVFTACYIIGLCFYLKNQEDELSPKFATVTISFFSFQLALGYLNVYWHAPHGLQLVHLLVALLSWVSYLLFFFRKLFENLRTGILPSFFFLNR